MTNLKATATRTDGIVKVEVSATLANPNSDAVIKDFYPGGGIVYITDPGEAQVFIEETVKPGKIGEPVILPVIPWADGVDIPDTQHSTVGIYVGGKKATDTPIVDLFIVTALANSEAPHYENCQILPNGTEFLAIYKLVYGPDSREKCEKFVSENGKPIDR